jgi:hypothetical protein
MAEIKGGEKGLLPGSSGPGECEWGLMITSRIV